MTEYKIAIPSKKRAGKTPTSLLFQDVPGVKVYFFVEPEEVQLYQSPGVSVVDIGASDQGISYVRNFILEYFKGLPIIMMDDDIKNLFIRKGGKLKNATPLEKLMLIKTIYVALEKGFQQATISYSASNWLCKESYKVDTRQWCILGIKNSTETRFDPSVDTFEDYDFTAQLLFKGHTNISLYSFAFACLEMGKTVGGLQCFDRKQLSEIALKNLEGKWRPFMRKKLNTSTGILEPQFMWKKLKRGIPG